MTSLHLRSFSSCRLESRSAASCPSPVPLDRLGFLRIKCACAFQLVHPQTARRRINHFLLRCRFLETLEARSLELLVERVSSLVHLRAGFGSSLRMSWTLAMLHVPTGEEINSSALLESRVTTGLCTQPYFHGRFLLSAVSSALRARGRRTPSLPD